MMDDKEMEMVDLPGDSAPDLMPISRESGMTPVPLADGPVLTDHTPFTEQKQKEEIYSELAMSPEKKKENFSDKLVKIVSDKTATYDPAQD